MAPYFLWGLKEQECAYSSLSISHVSSVLVPLEYSVTSTGKSGCWWRTFHLGELGRFLCSPLKAFVSIFVETGFYILTNLLFLRVSLRGPSLLTTNWSFGSTSITISLLSHLRGWAPPWFCSRHLLPTYRGCNFLALWLIDSEFLTIIVQSASPLVSMLLSK